MICRIRTGATAVGLTSVFLIAPRGWAAQVFALDSAKGLQPHNVTLEAVTYQARKALRVISTPEQDAAV